MTKDELIAELRSLGAKYNNDKMGIYKEFAYSNNPYKIGDIVTDHIGSLKIGQINVYVSNGESQCVYKGIELKKDLTPCKRQKNRFVYQSNLL